MFNGDIFNIEDMKYNSNIILALMILDTLGEERIVFDDSIIKKGVYFKDKFYEGYGLKIVCPDGSRRIYNPVFNKYNFLHIFYNDELVLSKLNYNRGNWEDILNDIYNKMPLLLEKKLQEEEQLVYGSELLNAIKKIGSIDNLNVYDGNIKIKISDIGLTSCNDENINISYEVYKNDKLVFKADNDNIYDYIPGTWEEQLLAYRDILDIENNLKLKEKSDKQELDDLKAMCKVRK